LSKRWQRISSKSSDQHGTVFDLKKFAFIAQIPTGAQSRRHKMYDPVLQNDTLPATAAATKIKSSDGIVGNGKKKVTQHPPWTAKRRPQWADQTRVRSSLNNSETKNKISVVGYQ